MRPRCIISDLDRTLTDPALVLDPEVKERIAVLRKSGIRVIIATGRRFEELLEMGINDLVDGIVAENGAIICAPGENVFQVLHADHARLAEAALGDLAPQFTWGRVVGSGPRVLAPEASARLTQAGVGHTLEFNAEEVMILPAGVDKASGSELCLAILGLVGETTWAIGDGENDVALLRWASVGAAPANAADATLAIAHVRLANAYSKGFLEFTEPLLSPPLARAP